MAAKHKASVFIPRLKAHVGDGYVYGGTGLVCTVSLLKAREKQYGAKMGDGYYCKLINGVKDFTRGKCAKWLGMWVADCSNLMQAIRREMGESIGSASANMLWGTCAAANRGAIKKMPRIPGVFVFRDDGGVKGHVGMYIGDGQVIESAGVTKGVILHPLSSAWTHWGIPNWLTMDVKADSTPVEPKPDEPIGGEETKPIFFVTTKDCCYLGHVANRFGLKDWRIITLEDGKTKPNPLLMRPGMKLIVGYEIAPVKAEPVYFTTTKDLYKLISIAKYFTEKLGVKINWTDIRTKDGKIPNPLGIQIGMELRIR